MEDGTVLNVDACSEADGTHVTADDGPEPDAAVVSGKDVAHHGAIGGQPVARTELGVLAPDGEHDRRGLRSTRRKSDVTLRTGWLSFLR